MSILMYAAALVSLSLVAETFGSYDHSASGSTSSISAIVESMEVIHSRLRVQAEGPAQPAQTSPTR